MNNLRKRYESPQGYGQRSPSGDRDRDHMVTSRSGQVAASPATYPNDNRGATSSVGHSHDRSVPPSGFPMTGAGSHTGRPTTPVRGSNLGQTRATPELTSDLIPGTLPPERPPPRPQPPNSSSMSTTELHKDEVIHHKGPEGRTHSHASKAVDIPKAGGRPLGGSKGYGGSRQSQTRASSGSLPNNTPPPPPTVATQAWQAQANPGGQNGAMKSTTTGPSTDPRTPHVASNSHMPGHSRSNLGVTNGGYVYDDGELLVPPKPRESTPRETHRLHSSYVPSQKAPEGSRSSNLTPHFNSQYGPPGSNSPLPPRTNSGPPLPNYLPPPQYNRPASQPQGEGSRESPHIGNRGVVLDKVSPPPPHRSSSHHIPPGNPQHHGSGAGNRNSPHGNINGPLTNRGNAHEPSGSRPMYPRQAHNSHSSLSNGRTSPLGQSSTPASQSPNHDQISPPVQGSKHYSMSNHKDSHHTNSQDAYNQKNIKASNPDLIISNSDIIGPSSAYPASVSMTKVATPQPTQSSMTQDRRKSSPVLTSREYHRLQENNAVHKTNQNGAYTRTGERISASPVTNNGNPSRNVSNEESGWRNSQWLNGSRQSGKQTSEIELHKLSSDQPPSRGAPAAESHWNESKPDIWDGRPVIRASADQWEDSDDSSITPPLPPLSPSNTPPVTPPLSPIKPHSSGPAAGRYSHGFGSKTPDILIGKGTGHKRRTKRSGTGTGGRMDGSWKKASANRSLYRSPGRTVVQAHHGVELDSGDNGSTTNASGTEDWDDTVDATELTQIRSQMEGLETMYAEILKMIGLDKEYLPGSRRSISSMSSTSRVGGRRSKAHMHSHRTAREIRQVNKRFSRLESHVVTLARSVAHLSSEMRSQNALYQELEELKKDVRQLKKDRHHSVMSGPIDATPGPDGRPVSDWERFRGWIPSISNPKRVKKLAKFFGQDRMLLYFLEKLGYQKYIKNFEAEEITILELPYMNEDRLQKLGIPMGPRQRILQEAQMCFRQENFSIYIV